MSQIIRELRGKKDTHKTNSPQRDDVYAMAQQEYCRTVRSSVKSGRSKQSSGVGTKVRHQPGPMGHQAGEHARGRSNPKARKTRTIATSLDATGATALTAGQAC